MLNESDILSDDRYRAESDATDRVVVCPDCGEADAPAPTTTPRWFCPECGARRTVEDA